MTRFIGPALLAALLAAAPALAQPAGIADAIRSVDPALRPLDGPGAMHEADFDGDGRVDVALLLTDGRRTSLVSFHDGGSGWVPNPLYRNLPAGDVQVRLVPPGRYRVLDPRGSIETSAPAIEIVFPGSSSALYVFREGRYQVFGTERY